MREEIDFSKSARLVPREDSWNKVVLRLQAKQEMDRQKKKKFILFRKLSSLSVAASVLLVAGAFFFGFNASAVQSDAGSTNDSSLESIAWYSVLGSGEAVSTFATAFDSYYNSIGD